MDKCVRCGESRDREVTFICDKCFDLDESVFIAADKAPAKPVSDWSNANNESTKQ